MNQDVRQLVAATLLAADLGSLDALAAAPASRRRRAYLLSLRAADELLAVAQGDPADPAEGFAGDPAAARKMVASADADEPPGAQ